MKKSGILLAALILSTFTLASSASAQTAPAVAPAAVQAVQVAQPVAPLPDFMTAPAEQTPAAPKATGIEWLSSGTTQNICRCTKNSQCLPHGMVCCYWPNQNCGYCCM